MLTDTHIHLYYPDFNMPIENMMQAAINKGIKRFFLPNVDSTSMPLMYKLHDMYPQETFMMMGLHPCSVKENYLEELAIVERELAAKKFVAIGEIGIDLYWDKTFIKEQQYTFEKQIEWSIEKNLPFVIHCRNAFNETYELLNACKQKYSMGKFNGIFHCFSGNVEQAEQVIDLGFKIGIGGVVTYKNSGLDKVVEAIDLNHIVLETDAPYLAPVPYRGKTNMPEYLYWVAEKIAFLKQTTVKEIATITTQNSVSVFGV